MTPGAREPERTPGEWRVSGFCSPPVKFEGAHLTTAQIDGKWTPIANVAFADDANACLISSAPELYAACERVVGFADTSPRCFGCGVTRDLLSQSPHDCYPACPVGIARAALAKAGLGQ